MNAEMFAPGTVFAWYRGWPTWAKWAGVVLLVVLLVLAVVWWLAGRSIGLPTGAADTVDAAATAHAAGQDTLHGALDKRDADATREVNAARARRKALEDDGAASAATREEAHDAIDRSDSIANTDAVVYGDRAR